jgi:phosphotransferase system enzyme I (PtsP)
LAETLDILVPKISFLSIGTNDLTQFLLAADRAHPKLAERYDWLSPSILRFLNRIIRTVDGSGIDLTVCGEMGGRRLSALALIGLGINRLSITPAALGPVKAMIRSVNLEDAKQKLASLINLPPENLRNELHKWARENDVEID